MSELINPKGSEDTSVSAGFPSPADDYLEKSLDLNARLLPHPASTFFIRAGGETMSGVGILEGTLLIVDRSCRPKNGDTVVATVNGDFTVRLYAKTGGKIFLKTTNPDDQPIAVTDEAEIEIWGVVTFAINSLR